MHFIHKYDLALHCIVETRVMEKNANKVRRKFSLNGAFKQTTAQLLRIEFGLVRTHLFLIYPIFLLLVK